MVPPLEEAFFKVLIVGDGAVGKTSICTHITTQEFFSDYRLTVGCDFFIKRIMVNNVSVTLQLFDTGGQDHFAKLRAAFAGGAKGVFLAFDVTRRDSFYNLEEWLKSIKDEIDPRAPMVLLGTKSDLNSEAEIWDEDITKMKEMMTIDAYFNTSSYTGEGVMDAFTAMGQLLLARYDQKEYSKTSQTAQFLEGFYRGFKE